MPDQCSFRFPALKGSLFTARRDKNLIIYLGNLYEAAFSLGPIEPLLQTHGNGETLNSYRNQT